jgi:hypothetical protein
VVKASANCFKEFFERTGAANRTRTCDPVITNDVLYQLSYCGGPNAASGVSRKRPHLISGMAPIGKKNAGQRSVFKRSMPSDLIRGWAPVRVKKTRQNKNLDA